MNIRAMNKVYIKRDDLQCCRGGGGEFPLFLNDDREIWLVGKMLDSLSVLFHF